MCGDGSAGYVTGITFDHTQQMSAKFYNLVSLQQPVNQRKRESVEKMLKNRSVKVLNQKRNMRQRTLSKVRCFRSTHNTTQ